MAIVGQIERITQERVLELFRDQLGYEYLGNWENRSENSNVEESLLEANLIARGVDVGSATKAISQFKKIASTGGGRSLYEANKDVYEALRYGVKVKRGLGEQFETVWIIDWINPGQNHFAVAQEVSIKGERKKRPDIVLYVNGVALGVIELKRSKVGVAEGIRQNIGNQKKDFIRSFFSTIQLLFAGNDVEGLRYGVIETPEKYWLEWKEPSQIDEPLDRALLQMCEKSRLLELIHDFMVFDSGVKKTARHNQYFGVKASQERVHRREGGVIWHTQGSGKSLTMVWLAKWIRENIRDSRVLIITDRTELDEQIQSVFSGVNEQIYRTSSGSDLVSALNKHQPSLIASLVHKFRSADDAGALDSGQDEFLAAMKSHVPSDFSPKGNMFVFVDEAHRTQSGKLHSAMKTLLPDAMFIGFTGTPLLKSEKATSIETFGSYIHTYKFDEAVSDGVVLDLRYEARNIDQVISGSAQVDAWFEAKTRGMTDLAKAELKKRWGTMQKVISAEPRTKRIVQDILLDMELRPRMMDGRGNAMLVASSIYQACRFYELFVQAGLGGKVAIITSYVPAATDVSNEDGGHGATERVRQYEIYRKMLSDYFELPPDEALLRIDEFESNAKRRFVKEPGQMRLLIVVDKLLTGFDAPPATYIYIDRKMRDHALFQAICRVNRLDGDDKTYGYVVDYQDLFNSLEGAIADYTSGALDGYEKSDVEGLLKDRRLQERQELENALERIRALCEPVPPPRETLQYQHYFCSSEPGDSAQLKSNEHLRVELYKSVSALIRAFGLIANDLEASGYSSAKAVEIRREVAHYAAVRDEVKLGSGENVDFKQFESGMRFLLDTYIEAGASEVIARFQDVGLVQLIAQRGKDAIDALPAGIRRNKEAVAETIINNVRMTIVDELALNPRYYEKMSELLDALVQQRRKNAISYKAYLQGLLDLASTLAKRESHVVYPDWVQNGAQRALFDFGWDDPSLACQVDAAIRRAKPHDWLGNRLKERVVTNAMRDILPKDFSRFEELFDLVKARDEYR